MNHGWDAFLYLEKGHLFKGLGFGSDKNGGGEAVFNTGLSGYQEVFSDPSYSNQVVVMTAPHIGNTGVNAIDVESGGLYLGGVVCREYCAVPSNYRSTMPLHDYLMKGNIPAISDVDTREITRILRDEGAQRSVIFPASLVKGGDPLKTARELIGKITPMEGLDLVSMNSCKAPYEFVDSEKSGNERPANQNDAGTMVVYDFGVKWNILRQIRHYGFKVWVVPYNTPQQEVLKLKPKAIVLSNGPGDPATVPDSVKEIQGLIGKAPILAICMGHQLLARAVGGSTYKLKFGHHGCNHPVKDLNTGRILITSQNHGFSVKLDGIKEVDISHISLNDQTVEGFASKKMQFSSVQFHPEAAPGPKDASVVFEQFLRGFIQ